VRGIGNVKLSMQNAEAMDFADGTFDFVLGSGILHQLDQYKAMTKLRCVLKPGGVVLFTESPGHIGRSSVLAGRRPRRSRWMNIRCRFPIP